MREVGHPPHVGVDRPRFDHIDKPGQSVRLEEPRKADERVNADLELDEVQWKERDEVERELFGVDVMFGECLGVEHDQAVLEEARSELDQDVQKVDEIADRVRR